MRGLPGTFAASLAILLLGLAALYGATEGGSGFTTETLRRSTVARSPTPVPDFSVTDAGGQRQALHALLAGAGPAAGRVWIVDFVYTGCSAVCLSLGTTFQQLQARIVEQGLQDRVGLISLSFDPARDDAKALADYARRVRAQPEVWQFASLRQPADRRRLLDSFGIMVVPAPLGEFEHNAALHVVTPDARLVRILGLEDSTAALALAQGLAQELHAARATP